MTFKKNILKKYLSDNEKIKKVISHWPWKYISIMLVYTWVLLGCFVSYYYLTQIFQPGYIRRVMWVLGLLSYIKFTISFMDVYLDSLVLTNTGIIIFHWDGFFNVNSENLPWSSVHSITDEKKWLLDVIGNQWDIELKREEELYTFQVLDPVKKANIISNIRSQMMSDDDKQSQPQLDKFDVLVETLWEVIVDYIQQGEQ